MQVSHAIRERRSIRAFLPETIPAEYHPVIEESLGETVLSGVLAGYTVLDVRVRITGGSF